MRIQIHTVHGRVYECDMEEDSDPAAVQFWEVFDRKTLGIALGTDYWALNPKYVEKIVFHPLATARWKTPENLLLLRVVSPTSHRIALSAIKSHQGRQGSLRPGDVTRGVVELTLASGSMDYLEFVVMLRPEFEQVLGVREIFRKPPYPIPCEGGGFALFNSANISMARIRPAITENRFADYRMSESISGQEPDH